jgi:hypothetical protein
LKKQNKELNELKYSTEGRTLDELDNVRIQAKEKEILAKANELFVNMKRNWELTKKPVEVLSEAIRHLSLILETLRRPKPPPSIRPTFTLTLQKEVEEMLNKEVAKRLDDEFLRRCKKSQNRNQK